MEAKYLLDEPLEFLQPFRPGKIIAIGRNYDAHARELGNEPPTEILYFAKTPSICIGPEQPILTKPAYGRVDYEGELGVLIGRQAKGVTEEEARACIAGYTIVNDVTAREMQKRDIAQGHPWYRSKNIDTFCPIGPAIALPDAFSWPLEITVETRVNGDIRQQGNTRDFIFPVARLISYVSSYMTLEPGDLIATGTPEGVGPLQPGDIVEVTIEGIGTLRNPVQSI
jgi:2-keto-4-pentenoate hydratase/2-oxohepta-3-ene-1,7-dioic acid hydratase in catechol pathway